MPSLNHVCMWSKHGWKHVTAEEASVLHPGGTVSAYSGLFMCELCGQYVILTDGNIRERYFKHSASEADKNCPERTLGSSFFPFTPQKYELPIRLILDSSGFRLELGLLRIPEEILQKYSKESVIIQTDSSEQYQYSFERLNPDMITYLPVGNIPSASYSIYSANEDRILFSVDNDIVCKGVFCNVNALTVQSGIITVKSEVSNLPVFTFLIGDTLQYQGTLILKKTELNTVEDLVRVYDPMEIVRDRMISRISWSVAEQKGFLKNEYRQIRDFLTELSADDLYTDIAESCDCSTEEARAYVEEYLKHADAVMNGTTLENSIMAQIIRNDASLYQACMNEIRDDWETQNHDKTAAAQASLDAVKAEENQRKAEVSALNAEFSDWQEKLRVIQASYREQEQLAEDVEKRVSEKIEQARQKAAEFIAEQAFIHPENRTVPVSVQGSSVPDDSPRFIPGAAYASEEPDIYDTYSSFLLTLQSELLEAGVSERQNIELSGILYAAFIERIPLLLIGPSGMDIAEALSVSLNCRYPDVLHCEGDLRSQAIAECRKSDADVIVIDNPFETKWRNSVMNLLSKREKFYIAVHPYAEDLVIEPKGLFNYCIPIFTDLLIDKLPTGNYYGGKASERFKHFEGTEATDFFGKILRKMGAGAITGWSIQKLSADMHRLLKIKETDADYQMLLYPLAYVLGELPLFADFMENDASKPSAQVIELLKERMGATE